MSGAIDPDFSTSSWRTSFYCRWSSIGNFIGHVMERHLWPFEEMTVLSVRTENIESLFRPRNAVFLCSDKVTPYRQLSVVRFRARVPKTIIARCELYKETVYHGAKKRNPGPLP